jgi:2-hydroxychromene-2-carboxylate isomerase
VSTPLTVYFDYMSPFAYIAAEVLPSFAERIGASLDWQPIDLMALSNYAQGLPYSDIKRRYVVIDAIRSAEYHDVKIRQPKPHPVLSGRAVRLAQAVRSDDRFAALHGALFRAAWRDQLDIGRDDVLADCIGQAGGPAKEWLAASKSDETEAGLVAATADAEAAGVFGVPSILLEGELFWGLDCLPMLEWRLRQITR